MDFVRAGSNPAAVVILFFLFMRSPLIVIEGLDRTGKTTQTTKLIERLQSEGVSYRLVKFPDRTTQIGGLINQYLQDKSFQLSDESAHLLFSANRWELEKTIVDSLNGGTVVILDRYVYSGVAYSSAKGLDFEWCLNPDRGLPKPDATIFLKYKDSATTSTREGYGDERYENVSFQEKVALQFQKFAAAPNWHSIDVDGRTIEQVEEIIWEQVQGLVGGVDGCIDRF